MRQRSGMFLSCLYNVFQLAVALFSLAIFNRVIPTHNRFTLAALLILFVATAVGAALLDAARSLVMVKTGHWIDHVFDIAAIGHMLAGRQAPSTLAADAQVVRSSSPAPSARDSCTYPFPWCLFSPCSGYRRP